MPARVTLFGAVILVPLSPALIFGVGPLPRLGIAGGGTAVTIYYVLAAVRLIFYLRSPRSPLTLRIAPLNSRLFGDILGVGLLSAIGAIQVNLTVAFVTAAVGRFGPAAIAGYGIASRLECLQIPVLFGLGTAVVTMVGINVGADQLGRARSIAWSGGVIAFGITDRLEQQRPAGDGLAMMLRVGDDWSNGRDLPPAPGSASSANEPDVIALGTLYLHNVAPVYGAVGLGMALYFASQVVKRVLWPVLAGTVRLIMAAVIGWLAVVQFGAGLSTLFLIVALAAALSAAIAAAAILAGAWVGAAVRKAQACRKSIPLRKCPP